MDSRDSSSMVVGVSEGRDMMMLAGVRSVVWGGRSSCSHGSGNLGRIGYRLLLLLRYWLERDNCFYSLVCWYCCYSHSEVWEVDVASWNWLQNWKIVVASWLWNRVEEHLVHLQRRRRHPPPLPLMIMILRFLLLKRSHPFHYIFLDVPSSCFLCCFFL